MDSKRLRSSIEIDLEKMNQIESRIDTTTSAHRRSVHNAIEKSLDNLIVDENNRIVRNEINDENIDEIIESLDDITDNGFQKMKDDIVDTFEERIQQANELIHDLDIPEGQVTDTDIDQLGINEEIENLTGRISEGREEAKRRMRRSIIEMRRLLGQDQRWTVSQLANQLSKNSGISAGYARTISHTELSAMDRTIRFSQGDKSGMGHYKYIGADDDLTRPWCLEHLDLILTKKQWEMKQNDTGPQPVIKYGGGYNCRHRFIFWNPEWEDMKFR